MDSIGGWNYRPLLRRTHLMGGLAIAVLTSIGSVLAITNPDQVAYETFATQKFVSFLNKNVCAEAPEAFNLRRDCLAMVQNNRSQLQDFLANNTYRRNFVFFSFYTTELSVAAFVPTYRVQTLGLLNQFYIYEAFQE